MFTIGAGPVSAGSGSSLRVLVVGAGPAGLASAFAAASRGATVVVFEQLPDAGRRLLATGGGHCNFTNALGSDEFARRFGPSARFVSPSFKATDSEKLRLFFEDLGVCSHSPDGFHFFPVSNSAVTVRDALVRACVGLGVELRFNAKVTGLGIEAGQVTGVEAGGLMERATGVVLAAGGASRTELGGGTSGFDLARQAGHTVVEACPALVPLVTRDEWPGTLAGITIPVVIVRGRVDGQPQFEAKGALLFTHRGVSGPAILDISGSVARRLQAGADVPILVDLAPHMTVEQWRSEFDSQKREHGTRAVLSVLRQHFPAALARVILDVAGVPADVTVARLSGDQRTAIIGGIRSLPLTVAGTEGMRHAMVCRGGVATGEIDRKTMQSKLAQGLFFAGEVMDIDGPCGGFNLQWAFSSGFLAGSGAARA